MKTPNLPPDGYQTVRAEIPARILRGMRTSEDFYEYLHRRVSRRSVLKGVGLAGAALAAGPVLWSKPGRAAEPPRGIRIAYGDDARTSMSVSWFTESPVAKPVVDVGTGGSFGSTLPAVTAHYKTPDSIPQQITYQHHVTIDGLEPGRDYTYRIRHDGGQSEVMGFSTAPDVIEPFRFSSFGDHGSDPNGETRRASWGTPYSPLAVQAIEQVDPAFHVHNGDLAYACGGPQDAWDAWAEEIQPRASRMPWMVALGNHEMELGYGPHGYDPFRSRFRLPRNGVDWTEERTSTFYSFRRGNVLFLMLDGNEAASEYGYDMNRGYQKGKQDAWIEATLKAGRADPTVDWILVSFHNCMYCTDVLHGSDGGCRARWQPLFEKYRVDVVLNGHNHCYERTYPILGADYTRLAPGEPVDPRTMGVTYVCAGGGGQLTARSASTYPQSVVHNEAGERENEMSLWRAARVDGYSIAVFDVDPGTPGGTTTLTLSTKEFSTGALAEVDRIVFERPAKAINARRVGGLEPAPAPKPKPGTRVGGVKQREPLPATGIDGHGVAGVAAGAAAIAAASWLRRAGEAGHSE